MAGKRVIDAHQHLWMMSERAYSWIAPEYGPLYDDFRICDVETGNVIYTVTPKSGHSGEAEIWGKENDFKCPIVTGRTLNECYKITW